MSIEKNTSGARQCGIGSFFDPIMRAAGCIPLEKMLAFLRSVSNFFDTLRRCPRQRLLLFVGSLLVDNLFHL